MKKIVEKFPQIQEEIEDVVLTTGKVTSCVSKSGRISEDGSIVYGNEKFIHIIEEDAWYDSQKNIHEIKASLQKVGSLVRNKGRSNIGCVVENPRNEIIIRKMVELNFRKEGPHTTCNKITAVGKIRVGLTLCRVQERIEIEKCFIKQSLYICKIGTISVNETKHFVGCANRVKDMISKSQFIIKCNA